MYLLVCLKGVTIMKKNHQISRVLLTVVSLIFAISITCSAIATNTTSTISDMSDTAILTTVFEYLTNESGETYGSDFKEQPIEPPDLQLARNEDGIVGYIRTSEIPGATVSNPEEAVRYKSYSGYINLYDKDGKTVIGQFFVN